MGNLNETLATFEKLGNALKGASFKFAEYDFYGTYRFDGEAKVESVKVWKNGGVTRVYFNLNNNLPTFYVSLGGETPYGRSFSSDFLKFKYNTPEVFSSLKMNNVHTTDATKQQLNSIAEGLIIALIEKYNEAFLGVKKEVVEVETSIIDEVREALNFVDGYYYKDMKVNEVKGGVEVVLNNGKGSLLLTNDLDEDEIWDRVQVWLAEAK